MSDHAAASAGSHGGDDIHGSPSPSFMQKNRLKLIIAGGFFGFLFVLIVGIAIGMTKRSFERTQYIEQIARLKVSFEETIETRKELEEKISELKKEVKEKKIEVEELEVKVEDLERRGGAKAGSEHAAPAAHGEAPKEGADIKPAGGGYVKFGGGDCVLPAGGGKGNAAWKECIKQNSNAKPEAPKVEAAPAKEPAGH
ncbi:hypothetical protein WAE56_11210 [Iodobacter sp. LRB]|uniref:hypothetical protein n=1 Tax=unclassified Iodobacter TaxID=235634 RepID=UPI000C0D37E1|nr:hypothetical protein [Iodobacter sp. BJB302]PHV02763.1 hypothetical protein CSQ88_04960 [Iodobacter sp. BJB302]